MKIEFEVSEAALIREVQSQVETAATAWGVFDGQQLEAVSLDRDTARDAANALCQEGRHGEYRRVALLARSYDDNGGEDHPYPVPPVCDKEG